MIERFCVESSLTRSFTVSSLVDREKQHHMQCQTSSLGAALD